MIVSINQPAYLPWLGYFDRIISSDVHIVLDHVQFEKNSMTNRNKVRTHQGWTWLSVPVLSKGKFGDLAINKLQISNNNNWQKKHWNTLRGSYAKAPFFNRYAEYFEHIYHQEWAEIFPLINEINTYLMDELSVDTKIITSSSLQPENSKSDLVLELCKKAGATVYLSGALGRDYLDVDEFEACGIEVQFQDYQHPTYGQIHGDFLPYMSVADLLFNEGGSSREILLSK